MSEQPQDRPTRGRKATSKKAAAAAARPAPAPDAPQPPAGGVRLDAAALLPPADAEAFLGAASGEPTNPVTGDGYFIFNSIGYMTADERMLNLIITQMGDFSREGVRGEYDSNRSHARSMFGVAPLDIVGLGEAAYWLSNPEAFVNNLYVLWGDALLLFNLDGKVKYDEPPAALVDLARVVLGRI